MPIPVGTDLAHYKILGALGSGAMGEVVRARDQRLDREVAIKILPDQFARDAERLKRFQREARTLATLNHPNVAQIFGVDQVGEICFLVLELVPGETLEDRLKHGPLPLDEARDVCRQIAEGLEAAHEAGVIHRDLKPGNVRITPDGRVKLLDFGLAKPMFEGSDGRASTSDSVLLTEEGLLMGTPTYMAPEQARAKPIDKRVDVWAFGCVLYECLTAQRAFEGETLSDVLAAVLGTEPDWSRLPPHVTEDVHALLRRCLEKDPRERLRDIGDARQVLGSAPGRAISARAYGARPPRRARAKTLVLWGASIVVAVFATYLALDHGPPRAALVTRTHINLPPNQRLTRVDGALALAPDGRTLAYAAHVADGDEQLFVRPLDSLVPQPLAGTADASYPFWSPDGLTLGFFAEEKLKLVPAGGGSVTTLCAASHARGGTWISADEIVFAPAPFGGLVRIPAAGGTPMPVTQPTGRTSHRLPHALPGGKLVLFTVLYSTPPDRDGIHVVDLDSGETTFVANEPSDARVLASGELWFVHGNLMGQPFDASARRLVGQARLVAEQIEFNPTRCSGRYTAAPDGTLVYQGMELSHLEWFDREGRTLSRLGAPDAYELVALSPDGRRVGALLARKDGGVDLSLVDAGTGLGVREPLFDSSEELAWSPDGRAFATSMPMNGDFVPCVRPLDGSPDVVLPGPGFPSDWSRDGVWLCLTHQNPGTGRNLYLVRADGSEAPKPVAMTAADEVAGSFSPDGRWLLFISDRGEQPELFVLPIGRAGAMQPVTSIGVIQNLARWTSDGRIVFQSLSGGVHQLDVVQREDDVEFGAARPFFDGGKSEVAREGVRVVTFDVSRDGQRMLAVVQGSNALARELVLVQPGGAADAR